jgi:hypothetical protein
MRARSPAVRTTRARGNDRCSGASRTIAAFIVAHNRGCCTSDGSILYQERHAGTKYDIFVLDG